MEIVKISETHRSYVTNVIKARWQVNPEEANSEFSRWLCNDKDSVCYVGLVDNKPMATGAFDTVRDEGGLDISPYNTLLWVEPEFRGNGYGKLLTAARAEWAIGNGHQIIYLDTIDAEKYHEKQGWKLTRRVHHNNSDYAIMHKILSNKLSFVQTRNIHDFGPILKPLVKDFSTVFYQTALVWCKIIPDDNAQGDKLWEVWLVKSGRKPIGICGLYTLQGAVDTKELWLGWLGIIPELRNAGLGKIVMQHLYKSAKSYGCEKLFSYVDKAGTALPFYEREGFEVINTVSEYCTSNGIKNIDGPDFEDGEDYVITKVI